ncbi:MAG: class I SAM-dependent methyltransferase [Bacteroidota bacterium]
MKFSRTFGAVYDFVMVLLEEPWLKWRRKRLLTGITGKVLEVGVGTGTNLKFYSHQTEVTGIEPSPHMIKRARKKRDLLHFPERINLHHTGCGFDDMDNLVAPESLDAVVCTLVLCTVPDPETSLCNFMKWLKPGGRLLVLEHIRSHNHSAGKLQDLLTPAWAKIAEGCQLNRPTDKLILQTGFQLLREEHFKIGMPFYEAEYRKPDS